MFKQAVTNGNDSPESPPMHTGGRPDSEWAKQPPLSEPPYRPYAEKPVLSEPPYKPYAEEPASDDPPYKPYKDI
jgi:hypothetical protein